MTIAFMKLCFILAGACAVIVIVAAVDKVIGLVMKWDKP